MSALVTDNRVLQEDVRAGLLRGVRVDVALRNFGQCLSIPEGSLAGMAEEDLAMSKVTKKLDDFLSHDWQTRRWHKFLALCVIYNGDAALYGSCAVACLLTALVNRPIAVLPRSSDLIGIPDEPLLKMHTAPWGFFCSLVTFWLLLFFGQRLRAIGGGGRMVFLDRLCINQVDVEEKTEGIASIAGFMRHSDRLVVLWSPRYFTRLWCVYEMATWLHLGKSLHSQMAFMPVGFAVGLLYLNMIASLTAVLILTAYLLPHVFGKYKVGLFLIALAAPWLIHTLRCLGHELRQLVSQLEGFSIRNADCWCCEQAHADPASGQRLPCDRALVHRTLHARRGSAAAQDALEAFDLAVRTTFKDAVSAAFGTLRISYRQAVLVAAPAAWGLPEVCSSVDQFTDPLRGFRYVVGYCTVFLCIMPITVKATLAAASLSVRVWPPKQSRLLDVAMGVGISLVPPVVCALQWPVTAWAACQHSGLPQLAVLFLEAAATAFCFAGCGRAPCCGRARREEPPDPVAAVEPGDRMAEKLSDIN